MWDIDVPLGRRGQMGLEDRLGLGNEKEREGGGRRVSPCNIVVTPCL